MFQVSLQRAIAVALTVSLLPVSPVASMAPACPAQRGFTRQALTLDSMWVRRPSLRHSPAFRLRLEASGQTKSFPLFSKGLFFTAFGVIAPAVHASVGLEGKMTESIFTGLMGAAFLGITAIAGSSARTEGEWIAYLRQLGAKPEKARKVAGLLARGELPLAKAKIEVHYQNAKGKQRNTSVDAAIAHAADLLHSSENVIVLSPQGLIVLRIRAHDGFYPHYVSMIGAHKKQGQSSHKTISRALVQQLGFLSDHSLEGDLIKMNSSEHLVPGNREIRGLWVYRMSEEEWNDFQKKSNELNIQKSQWTLTGAEEWLKDQRWQKSPFGHVWGWYALRLPELFTAQQDRKGRYFRILERRTYGQQPRTVWTKTYLTPDLLEPFLDDAEMRDSLKRLIKAIQLFPNWKLVDIAGNGYATTVYKMKTPEGTFKAVKIPRDATTINDLIHGYLMATALKGTGTVPEEAALMNEVTEDGGKIISADALITDFAEGKTLEAAIYAGEMTERDVRPLYDQLVKTLWQKGQKTIWDLRLSNFIVVDGRLVIVDVSAIQDLSSEPASAKEEIFNRGWAIFSKGFRNGRPNQSTEREFEVGNSLVQEIPSQIAEKLHVEKTRYGAVKGISQVITTSIKGVVITAAVTEDGDVWGYNVETGDFIRYFRASKKPLTSVALIEHHGHVYLFTADQEGFIRTWDWETRQEIPTKRIQISEVHPQTIDVREINSHLIMAAGYSDKTIRYFDWTSRRELTDKKISGLQKPAVAIHLVPRDQRHWSIFYGDGSEVKEHDYHTGDEISSFSSSNGLVTALQPFEVGESRFIGIANRKGSQVWDLATREEVVSERVSFQATLGYEPEGTAQIDFAISHRQQLQFIGIGDRLVLKPWKAAALEVPKDAIEVQNAGSMTSMRVMRDWESRLLVVTGHKDSVIQRSRGQRALSDNVVRIWSPDAIKSPTASLVEDIVYKKQNVRVNAKVTSRQGTEIISESVSVNIPVYYGETRIKLPDGDTLVLSLAQSTSPKKVARKNIQIADVDAEIVAGAEDVAIRKLSEDHILVIRVDNDKVPVHGHGILLVVLDGNKENEALMAGLLPRANLVAEHIGALFSEELAHHEGNDEAALISTAQLLESAGEHEFAICAILAGYLPDDRKDTVSFVPYGDSQARIPSPYSGLFRWPLKDESIAHFMGWAGLLKLEVRGFKVRVHSEMKILMTTDFVKINPVELPAMLNGHAKEFLLRTLHTLSDDLLLNEIDDMVSLLVQRIPLESNNEGGTSLSRGTELLHHAA